MSELRLYIRRDSLQEGVGCTWVLLNAAGRVERSGSTLDNLPSARHCRLVLATDMVLLLQAELPNVPARKLAPMLPAVAEAATLDDAEQLHVVMLGIKPGGSTRLAVVRNTWLERVLSRLRDHGLYPDQAVPESLLLPWAEGDWSMLVHEDGVVARFGLYDAAALDQGDPPAGAHLALSRGAAPKRIRLYQGSALKAPNAEIWSDALDLPVEAAGKWDWREAAWNEQANLLSGNFAPARGRRDWRALARPMAIGLALLASLQVFGMTLEWVLLKSEQSSIQAEARALAERALPAHAAVVDPAWQVSDQWRGMRSTLGGGNDGFLALLARLGQIWLPGEGHMPKSLLYSGGQLDLTFASVDQTWLDQLKHGGSVMGLVVTLEKGETGQALLRIRSSATGSGGQ